MNVINLCGGLGNQLFQYAFGRAQMATGTEVKFDARWYKKFHIPSRLYVLDKFYVDVKLGPSLYQTTIKEGEFDATLINARGFNFRGYWQNPDYFKAVLPELRKEFRLREEFYTDGFLELKERISNNNSVAIHVRRGDYVGNNGWRVLPMDYYLHALKIVKGLKQVDKVYIFSDDIEWCQRNFGWAIYDCKGIETVHLDECLDFELMKACKHQIIANSTFSWWAAELNENPNKIIITPEQWNVKKEQEGRYNTFLCPEGWVKV